MIYRIHRLILILDLRPIRHLSSAGARFFAGLSVAIQAVGYFALDADRVPMFHYTQAWSMTTRAWGSILVLIGFLLATSAGIRFNWYGRTVSAAAVALCILFAAVWHQFGAETTAVQYLFLAVVFVIQAAHIQRVK